MPRVLITGGSGGLGHELVPRFRQAGYTVRISSRRPAPPKGNDGLEWAQASLETGDGLAEAVAGVDVIAHAATSPFRRTRQVDVEGTGRLREAARAAGTPHLFYISIVGVDRVPLPYYRAKLAAERLIEESGVPWSNLRATQFHSLIDRFLRTLVRLPIALIPKDLRFQPIDTGEVAERMVAAAARGPSGRLPDLGGPEVHTFGELARAWLKARGKRVAIIHLPLPGKAAAALRRGELCTANAEGAVTWGDWLARTYGGTGSA